MGPVVDIKSVSQKKLEAKSFLLNSIASDTILQLKQVSIYNTTIILKHTSNFRERITITNLFE